MTLPNDLPDDFLTIIAAPINIAALSRTPLRRLANEPLLARAVHLARAVGGLDTPLCVLTDDEEVDLLARRLSCSTVVSSDVGSRRFIAGPEAVKGAVLACDERWGKETNTVLLINVACPLLTKADVLLGLALFEEPGHDAVFSVAPDARRRWREGPGGGVEEVPATAFETESGLFRETASFAVLSREVALAGSLAGVRPGLAVIPAHRGIEVRSPHEWWICQRVLARKRVVFVVVGHDAVGLGHAYRTTSLAHECVDHEVVFVCTRESELAAHQIEEQGFQVVVDGGDDLASTVLSQDPDLIVNDILDTSTDYMRSLKSAAVPVVNFEDLGEGEAMADLVINAIYAEREPGSHSLNGPEYFCIRDEFLDATPSAFRDQPLELLITFGGTDPADLTSRVSRLLIPQCIERGMHVSVVTGPGYDHTETLRDVLSAFPGQSVEFANGTKQMSEYMSRADIGVSGAGRTVFELAAMRVPSIILAAHEREVHHTFASADNGMVFLGRQDLVTDEEIVGTLARLADDLEFRSTLWDRTVRWGFKEGKSRVVEAILDQITKRGAADA